MVADGGLEWTRRDSMTGCPPIIHGLYASQPPSGSAAVLSLRCNRARSLRPARHFDRSVLRDALVPAVGNTCRRPTVDGGSPWREGGLFYARLEPRGCQERGRAVRVVHANRLLAITKTRSSQECHAL